MARGERSDPIPREAARVLLVDARARLLLFHVADPLASDERFWITPGGALEPGEGGESAALRELDEETGLRDVPLGPLVWRRRHIFLYGDQWFESLEQLYFLRIDAHEVGRAATPRTNARSCARIVGGRSRRSSPPARRCLCRVASGGCWCRCWAGELPREPREVGA